MPGQGSVRHSLRRALHTSHGLNRITARPSHEISDTPLSPPRNPHRAGPGCAAPDQSLPEQQAGAGSPGHQRSLSIHARVQVPQISRPVLPGLRRTPQLPPPSLPPSPLPPSPARSGRSPEIAPPPEDRDRAGHLASRMTLIGLIPAQAILASASPDRTHSGAWWPASPCRGCSRKEIS